MGIIKSPHPYLFSPESVEASDNRRKNTSLALRCWVVSLRPRCVFLGSETGVKLLKEVILVTTLFPQPRSALDWMLSFRDQARCHSHNKF